MNMSYMAEAKKDDPEQVLKSILDLAKNLSDEYLSAGADEVSRVFDNNTLDRLHSDLRSSVDSKNYLMNQVLGLRYGAYLVAIDRSTTTLVHASLLYSFLMNTLQHMPDIFKKINGIKNGPYDYMRHNLGWTYCFHARDNPHSWMENVGEVFCDKYLGYHDDALAAMVDTYFETLYVELISKLTDPGCGPSDYQEWWFHRT